MDVAVRIRAAQWISAIVVLLVVGELWTRFFSDSIFFPQPSEVIEAAWDRYITGSGITEDLLPSLWRFTRGWWLAVATGIGLGLLLGLVPVARAFVNPLIQFGRAIPPPLVLGAFLILFGTSDAPKVFLIAFGSVWPVLFNTMAATAAVHPAAIETARAFGKSRSTIIRRVTLPSISPQIVAGMKVSLSIGLILMVLTEFVGASNGLGFALIRALRSFDLVDMWASLLVLAILGLTMNVVLLLAERRALAWHRGEKGQLSV